MRLALGVVALASGALCLPSAAQPREIEEIVVTARKQPQRAVDVPIALSVLRGEAFDEIRAAGGDIRLLSGRVPSLQITSSFGRIFPYMFVRGLGNTDFDLNASQPVSVMHDGVVLENPLLKGAPLYDLARVEVLRGPQGTLFGRNTPAGLVKVESAPPTWVPEGFGRLVYGRFDSVNFEGAASGTLIDGTLAARASVLVQRRSDWVDNAHTGEDDALGGYRDVAARLQLLWNPREDVEGRFKLHLRDLVGTARLFRASTIEPGVGGLRPGFERGTVAMDGRNEQQLGGHGLALDLRYGNEQRRLVSVTGMEWLDNYSRGDIDGASPPYGPGQAALFPSETADGHPALRQFSQEIRLETTTGRLAWRVGLFYFRESLAIDSFSFDSLRGGAQNGYARQHQRTRAWGAFAATTYNPTEQLELDFGVRLSDDKKAYQAERLLSPFGAGPLGPMRRNPQDRVPSWDVSLHYRPDSGIQPYLRVASSFRAPSIQGRLLFGNDVTVAETERIVSVEAGVKLHAFQQRLRLDAAAYRYSLRDQQLTAVGGVVNANRLVNAERTEGRGVEVELDVVLGQGLRLQAGASYNHTRIDDPNLAVQPCGAGCIVLDPPGALPGTVALDGNGLPHAPRFIANVGLRYARPTASGAEIAFSTDWAYRSRVFFFLYESREYQDDRQLEGAVRMAWRSADGGTELAAFGRNILDDVSPAGGLDFNNLASYVNEPPFWGVEATLRR